jgi:glucose dehydrogenase
MAQDSVANTRNWPVCGSNGDLVISGISGGDEGVRGFLSAYNASTGERVWRFWTLPAPGEPGAETWVGTSINHPGSSTWMTGTYDSEADILYWGVGNPGPDHNGDQRKAITSTPAPSLRSTRTPANSSGITR